MKDTFDARMLGEERGDLGRRSAAPRMRELGRGQAGCDPLGARVVEDAAAHRDQVHQRVAEVRVIRGDVATEREVLAAESLGQRSDHDRRALCEQRRGERPWRGDAVAAFRTGWTALRVGDNAEAIAAFDRATDPIVAEDATYWCAIASERARARAGDNAGAVSRYRELAAETRAAITRLAAPEL